MASTYSPKLKFELIGAGEQAGLWGTTTNKNIGELIEQAIAGVTTVDLTGISGDYTLSSLDGTVDQARSAVISCTGTASGAINVIIPTSTKLYVFRNATGYSITIKTASQVGGVVLANGEANSVFCNGAIALAGLVTAGAGTTPVSGGGTGQTSFTAGFLVSPSPGGTTALTTQSKIVLTSDVSGALPVANGGTGQSTFNSGGLLIGNGTSAVATLTGGIVGYVPTWNGSTWVATAPTSSGVTSVSGTGSVNGITLTGTVTSSGSLTLGGSLSGSAPSLSVGSATTAGSATNATNATNVVSGGTIASNVTATTQVAGTSNTTVATTAFVNNNYAALTGATFTGSVINQYLSGITASGTTQTTATGYSTGGLNADTIYVTIASATIVPWSGIILPSVTVNKRITVVNNGSNPIYVYPPVNGYVDNQLIDVPVVVLNGKQLTFVGASTSPNIWVTNYTIGYSTGGLYSYAKSNTDGAGSQIKIESFDGTNTGSKTIRVSTFGDSNGALEIINKNYSAGIFSLNDIGDLVIAGSTAQKASGTTWSNPSDIRLKNNVQNYTDGLSKLVQVQPRTWDYNGKAGTVAGTKGIGVVADEIESVLPDTVSTYKAKLNENDAERIDIKQFDATEITWLLVNSVKELKAELDAAKAEITALKGVK